MLRGEKYKLSPQLRMWYEAKTNSATDKEITILLQFVEFSRIEFE